MSDGHMHRSLIVVAAVALGASCASPDPAGEGVGDAGPDGGDAMGTAPDVSSLDAPGATLDTAATDAVISVAEAQQLCARHVEVSCALEGRCSRGTLSWIWGDVERCKQRTALKCVSTLTAPGSSWTAAQQERCTQALSQVDCGAAYPAECQSMPGALPEGSPCAISAQCQNLYCRIEYGQLCGACTPKGGPGAACRSLVDCQSGSWCIGKLCSPARKLGEPCDPTHRCVSSLVCLGEATGSGVCSAARALGEPCDPRGFECAGTPDFLYCKVPAGSAMGTCQPEPLPGPGEPCGWFGEGLSGHLVACAANGLCSSDSTQGTCVAPGADGAPCGGTTACLDGARCFQGVCRLVDPAACR
jgi:hypothetical protein